MELRFYTFINFYLSSIQQGIQSAHLVHELLLKYGDQLNVAANSAFDWARDHKTMIVLNGGGTKELVAATEILKAQSAYPWVEFHESEDCLSGVLTGVGVVLPENVFNAERIRLIDPVQYFQRPSGEYVYFGQPDYDVIDLVKSKGLAK